MPASRRRPRDHQAVAHAVNITVRVPLRFTVRGGRKTIIGETSLPAHAIPRTRFDDSVIKALARAYRWKKKLEDGTYATVGDLAKAEQINESYVKRLLRLNLLAPHIVEAALNRRAQFTVQCLSEPISPIWREQRSMLEQQRSTIATRSTA
jgi:hypothetical protein